MDFDTGRSEWDNDYKTNTFESKKIAYETKENAYESAETDSSSISKVQYQGSRPRQLPSRPQRLVLSTGPRSQTKDDRPPTQFKTPLLQANHERPVKVQELRSTKALPDASKTATGQKKKSHAGWAENPGLTTNRKSHQAAMDADSNKYLGPLPENIQLQFMGFHRYDDIDIISRQGLNKKWDVIRLGCQAYIHYDIARKAVIIWADKKENCLTALRRIRLSMYNAEVDEESCRPRYIVESPSTSSMRLEVIVVPSTDKRIELAGPWLSGDDLTEWEHKRQEMSVSNEKLFMEHLKTAFTRLCVLNSSMQMRVQFGTIILTRYRGDLEKPEFPFDRFVKMMDHPKTAASFEKTIGGVDLGSKIIQKINESSDMFCPLDAMVEKLSSIQPKQRILYHTNRGNATYCLDAEIDISLRDEYQLGANSLFKEDSALKKRLDIGFMGFNSKFHWRLEVVTKEKLPFNSVAVQDTVRHLLASTRVKQDNLGFPYPILKSTGGLNADDKATILTMLQYKLVGTPYILEISLYRDISSGNVGGCEVSMYSKNWDDQLGPTEADGHGHWELGSDVQLLFPRPGPSPVFAGNQATDGPSGIRSFFDAVAEVKSFLSAAV